MIKIGAFSLEDFRTYLLRQKNSVGSRPPEATVLHHTYRPRGSDFRGLSSIEGIRDYHVNSRKWGDIGANAYAGPRGKVYNARPLSASNYAHAYVQKPFKQLPHPLRILAGTYPQFLNHHAFGIETIGNFDREDPAKSPAMTTALDVLAMVHEIWDIPVYNCFFHRDVAYKTCPGKRVSKVWVHDELERRLQALRVFVLPGSVEVACNAAVVAGTTRCDLRPLAEALGATVIADNLASGEIFVRREE